MSNISALDICTCGHDQHKHVRVIVLSGPGDRPDSVPAGEIHRCMQCLCRDFQAQEDTYSFESVVNISLQE